MMNEEVLPVGSPSLPTSSQSMDVSSLAKPGQADRQYRLSLWIPASFFDKVVRAQRQLRPREGVRDDLVSILEQGLDKLLASNHEPKPAPSPTPLENGEPEPETLRAPCTARWHPQMGDEMANLTRAKS